MKRRIIEAIEVAVNEGQTDLDPAAARAAIDDLVQSARRAIDEPGEDASAALDAALAPWEEES